MVLVNGRIAWQVDAGELARNAAIQSQLLGLVDEHPVQKERCSRVSQANAKNKVLTTVVAAMLDGPAALRRYMIDNFVVEGPSFHELMSDSAALEAFVRKETD